LKKSAKKSQKIVIKVGSSVLTGGRQSIVEENLHRIVRCVVRLVKGGNDVILVSSGAIASALSVLGFKKRKRALPELQAAAATGQNILMQVYSTSFEKMGLKCAQILLTREDFGIKKRYINAKNTIDTLLRLKVVPIINENDVISVDEIKFGDNDILSALVAAAVDADGLLLLTDVEGLYKGYNSKTKEKGKIIKEINKITQQIEGYASDTANISCIGGMSSKIEAARIATNLGIPVIMASGLKETLNIDFKNRKYEDYDGTRFLATRSMGKRKHWIAFSAMAKGKILVDEGARNALIINSKSLLNPGVINTEGIFEFGDIVHIADSKGDIFAKGKVRFSSFDLQQNKGKKLKGEVVHRDNLVILG